MTDNEIIKALECCIKNDIAQCKICAYDKFEQGCRRKLNSDILDLINRQQVEIKSLNHSLKCQKDHIEKLAEHSKNQRTEIEELKKENKDLAKRLSDADSVKLTVEYWEQSIKYEAIKEFAERLCNGRVSNDPVVIAVKTELIMRENDFKELEYGL